MTGTTMVEIQCPHCDEDIELEDGVSGLFDCPHCDKEFSWNSASKWSLNNILKWMNIVAVVIFVIGLILFLIMLVNFWIHPPSGYGGLIILGPIGMMITGVTVSYLSLLIWIIGKKIRKEFVHKGLFYSAIAPWIILLLFMFPISILLG
jgi:hypothetical protein